MSRTALLEPAPLRSVEDERRPPGGEQPTLGDIVARAWEGLLADGAADCPACGDRMELVAGAGRCGSCGSVLS
jgi:hypothetical protein